MINIYLSDQECSRPLRPLSLTTHVADIRIGILTIKEKWQLLLGDTAKITTTPEAIANSIIIPANIIPTASNYQQLLSYYSGTIDNIDRSKLTIISHPWQLHQLNDWALREDFSNISASISSDPTEGSHLIHPDNIHIASGARITHAVLNASTGPIYIEKDAVIMEGVTIRGPFSMGEGSVVKMGARIYGATTIGKYSVVGGELKNVIIGDYSAKAHDGYLGDSIIGNWCNLGAGTTCSNIKNNASEVSVKIAEEESPRAAGLKCGLIMGDFSRTAINISFHTGSVVGVCSNIFDASIPAKFINHFSWGKDNYIFDKAIADIGKWMKLKGIDIPHALPEKLFQIYQQAHTS